MKRITITTARKDIVSILSHIGEDRFLLFARCLILCLLCYGIFLFPHYILDAYNVVHSPSPDVNWTWRAYGEIYVQTGRFTLGLLMYALAWIGIHPYPTGLASHMLSIVLMATSLFVFFQHVRRFFSTRAAQIAAFACSAFVFCNPFFAEWFAYTGNTPYYCAGMLGMTATARLYFAKPPLTWRRGLACAFLVVLCVGIYHLLLAYFAIFCILFSLLQLLREPPTTSSGAFRRYLSALTPAGIICAGITAFQAINARLGDLSGRWSRTDFMVWENLKMVLYKQPELWLLKAVGIDNALFLVLFLCGMTGLIVLCIRRRKNVRAALIPLILLSWGLTLLATFATHILAEAWLNHRTTTAFPSQLAFCWLPCLLLLQEVKAPLGQRVTKGVCVACALMIALFTYSTARLGTDILKTNAIDAQISRSINQVISRYEAESGISVTKAALVYDQQITHAYPDTVSYYDLVRTWKVSYAALDMFQFYTGRELKRVEASEDIKWHFYWQDWQEYSDEQVLFLDDTVVICIY